MRNRIGVVAETLNSAMYMGLGSRKSEHIVDRLQDRLLKAAVSYKPY